MTDPHDFGRMKTTLVICDTNWSTGSMARDLAALLPHRRFILHDWSTAPPDLAGYDSVLCMTLTCAARSVIYRDAPNAVHVNLHPNEWALPEVRGLPYVRPKLRLGAVSRECQKMTDAYFPHAHPAAFVPVAVHMERFKRRAPRIVLFDPRRDAPRRAGFIGFDQPENTQCTGATKRPEMFAEICQRACFVPVYSGKRFTYETMQDFYDSIDVLVCTSSTDGGPLPPLEAISCGVPAISTDVGNMHDFEIPGRFDDVTGAVKLLQGDLIALHDRQYTLMRDRVGGHHVAALWDELLTW